MFLGLAVASIGAELPLPPRALLRLGTNDFRTENHISDLAFSPDGKIIAASEDNSDFPRVTLFDVSSGREVTRITPRDPRVGWVTCIAFSPDQTKLLWGEIGGLVTLWDLNGNRALMRAQLHKGQVNDVAFSPDGNVMATAGDDGVIHLRRTQQPEKPFQELDSDERQPAARRSTGGEKRIPVGPLSVAFTPDGARLVVGAGSSGTISVWRLADHTRVLRIENAHGNSGARNSRLNSVTVTPDGRRIVAAGQHTLPIEQTKLKYGPRNCDMSELRVWDLETGKLIADVLDDESHGFGFACLSRDGRHAAVGDFSRLRLIDVETKRAEQTIPLPGSWGKTPAFSPDASLVAMPIANTIGLFETRTGRRLHHGDDTPANSVRSAAWSPSGDRIVTGNSDGEVRVWDATTGKLVWHQVLAPVISPSGHNAGPYFVAFSRDGRRVVVAGRRDDPVEYRNGIVAIYEANKGLLVRRVYQHEIRDAALSPDRKLIVVASSHGSIGGTRMIGIDLETGQTLYVNPAENERGFWMMAAMQFRPNAETFDVVLRDGNVHTYHGSTGKLLHSFVADWRTQEEKNAGRVEMPDLWEATFSADARTMVCSREESVYVWDVDQAKLRLTIRQPHKHGCHLALSPDGRTLATADYVGDPGENAIRLFNVETGEQTLALDPGDLRAGVLAFSPDGNKLFSGFHRGSALIWDLKRADK